MIPKKIVTYWKKYFFPGIKNDIVEYISKCMKCHQVKVEHKHSMILLQRFPILEWKWEVISMEFIKGLPMNVRNHESIMVVVDTLSKKSHFILIKYTYKMDSIANIFMKEIFKGHDLPKAIILGRETKFTSNVWKSHFVDLGMQLNISTTYHPQMDGKPKRLNQVLEYMLHMYVMEKLSKWEDYLPLVEFSYNNGK